MAMMRDLSDMVAPAGFPRLGQAQAQLDSLLATRMARVAIPIAGVRQEVRLAPGQPALADDILVRMTLGDCNGILGFKTLQAATFLPELAVGIKLDTLPEVLADAVVATAFGPVLEALTPFFDARPQLFERVGAVPDDWIAVGLKARDRALAGVLPWLFLDPDAARKLTQLAQSQLKPRRQSWTGNMPIRLELERGVQRLPAGEFRTLRRGDVLLMPPKTDIERATLIAGSDGNRLAAGRLDGATFTLEKTGRAAGMPENDADNDTTPQDSVDLDALTVTLSFVAGRKDITLSDLQALAPGAIFELDDDGAGEVSVRSAGREIGRGEFVRIAGRLGVRLVSFGSNKDG